MPVRLDGVEPVIVAVHGAMLMMFSHVPAGLPTGRHAADWSVQGASVKYLQYLYVCILSYGCLDSCNSALRLMNSSKSQAMPPAHNCMHAAELQHEMHAVQQTSSA